MIRIVILLKDGDTIIAMNGTERSVSFVSNTTEMTDTESILDLISKYNLEITALNHFSSIFIGFTKGKPFVVANNTSNIKMYRDNKALVFASTFPTNFRKNIYEPKEKFIWNGGNIPDVFEKYKRYSYRPILFDDYTYHEDLYEQCYIKALEEQGGETIW